MSNEEKIRQISQDFPFPGYIDSATMYVAESIASTVEKYIKSGAKILDFGSGPCDKTAFIQSLGYKCSAFDDLSDEWHRLDNNLEKILSFAKKYDIDLKLAEHGYLPFPKEHFDLVMSHDVLEHLHDSPRELLIDLCELLKPGGYLFITVPSAVNIRKRLAVLRGQTNLPSFDSYYWYQGPWRGHVREYVKSDLRQLSQYLGLETFELRSCHHMLHVVPSRIRPFYRAVTSIFTGWRDSWLLVARKPENWVPKRKLSETEFAQIMGKISPYYR